MATRAGGRRRTRVGIAGAGLVAIALGASLPPRGPVLLDVLSPAAGATVGLRGVELLVRLREPAIDGTLRVLLNGADVTDLLMTGENGAYGRLFDLLPGPNLLRIEVSGRVPWAPARRFEQVRELPLRMRPPIDLDRG